MSDNIYVLRADLVEPYQHIPIIQNSLETFEIFLVVGWAFFLIPLIASTVCQLFIAAWYFCNDFEGGRILNPVHKLYFTKVLGCEVGTRYRSSPYDDGKKWFSEEVYYGGEEFWFHHFLHSSAFALFLLIAYNVPVLGLTAISLVTLMFVMRYVVRLSKKIVKVSSALQKHMEDPDAHKYEHK